MTIAICPVVAGMGIASCAAVSGASSQPRQPSPAVSPVDETGSVRVADMAVARQLADSPEMRHAIDRAREIWTKAAGRVPETAMEEAVLATDLRDRAFYVALISLNNDETNPAVTQFGWRAVNACGLNMPATGMTVNNQDNAYFHIPTDGSATYLLRGRLVGKGPFDFSFKLADGWPNMVTVDTLAGAAIKAGEDGSFTIHIGPQRPKDAVNFLRSEPGRLHSIMIRETLGDWSSELPHRYSIERLPGGPPVSRDIAPPHAADLYIKYITDMTRIMTRYSAFPPNAFGKPYNSVLSGGLAVQLNAEGQYHLAEDETMIVTVKPGAAGYFNIQIIDPWLGDIESDTRIGELNNLQAERGADGTYTFVISAKDPEIHNWLDISGLPRGFLYSRFQRFPEIAPVAENSENFPTLVTRVVKLSNLGKYVTDRKISPQERVEQLENRAVAYRNRIICEGGAHSDLPYLLRTNG